MDGQPDEQRGQQGLVNSPILRYNARTGTTNVPNLLRNTPPNRIQTGRGNDRSVVNRGSFGDGCVVALVFMDNKKTCRPSGGQGWESIWFGSLKCSRPPKGDALRIDAPPEARHGAGDDKAAQTGTWPAVNDCRRVHFCTPRVQKPRRAVKSRSPSDMRSARLCARQPTITLPKLRFPL
jgi:hypothetical protein